jgi:indole-3-glycerol phosphate synthase
MSTAPAPSLLAAIVAGTRRSVEVREQTVPITDLAARISRPPDGQAFISALTVTAAPRIIAECKRRSPSRGILRQDYEPAAHARSYEEAGAAAISVLTEPTFFDGALEHLQAARAAVSIPILRKDFIVTEYQLVEAAAAGADAVLLIAGALANDELHHLAERAAALGLAALVEVHDRAELDRALDARASIVGVNSRDLRTLAVDPDVLLSLAPAIPDTVVAVAESGLRTTGDLRRLTEAGYDAFLVGERLIAHSDPGAALRELRA